ncbi:MAG TPA: SRPBCC family protein [Gemmatimonadaceae bacterium]|nr:SRPBCC family protein [Gemmatimonadaceae bacterium]
MIGGGTLAVYGMRRRDRTGALLTAVGGSIIVGAIAEGATPVDGQRMIYVERSVTIDAPADELYSYWRQLSHLPEIMRHLESVTEISPTRSRWVAHAPGGTRVSWEAEIVDDTPGQRISWRSLPHAAVPNAGSVRFQEAPANRGTEVHVRLTYDPPFGRPGATVAKLFGEEPDIQVREDLRRFKRKMETGELPTIDGQPHGR